MCSLFKKTKEICFSSDIMDINMKQDENREIHNSLGVKKKKNNKIENNDVSVVYGHLRDME